MRFQIDELLKLFDPLHLERGHACQEQGRVISAEQQQDGGLIVAMVRGSRNQIYKLLIRVERSPVGALQIDGQCSCPARHNCEHVVAALLTLAIHTEPRDSSEPTLPLELGTWLDRLREANRRNQPVEHPDRLLYLLNMAADYSGSFLTVTTVKARRLQSGGYGKPARYTAGAAASARFLRPRDLDILSLLEGSRHRGGGSHELRSPIGARVLEAMLETGRCHWESKDEPALLRGKPLQSPLAWELEVDGTQSVRALSAPEGTLLLPLAPPWYLELESGLCGPVVTGLPDTLAEALAAAPPVALEQAESLARAMEGSFPDQDLPAPLEPNTSQRDDVEPVPCLRLRSEKDEVYYPGEAEPWDHYAELYFDYDGLQVHPMDEEPLLVHRNGDELELVLRHADAEIAYFEQLVDLGFEPHELLPDDDHLPLTLFAEDEGWLDFVLLQLPELREEGWHIEIDPSFRFQLVEPQGWYGTLEEDPGGDWLDLELGVELEGEHINLLPILAEFLRTIKSAAELQALRELPPDHPMLCPLEGGRVLRLPLARAQQIFEVLTELNDPKTLDHEGRLRLHRHQGLLLADLARDGLQWEGGKQLLEEGRRLRALERIPQVEPPTTLDGQLRPYQQEGLSWLQFLREYNLGGILADDMGLGKTIQVLAHLLVEQAAGRADRPSLVVAPTSLMPNWRRESERFAPGLRVLTLHGPQRRKLFDAIPEHDLVLTTYPLLPRDAEALLGHEYHLLILDEAQHIKNPRAKAAETACRLPARHRICLTGTPLENHLGELWSQFHFLMPGFLGERQRFRKLFRTPIEKHADPARSEQLRRRIAPFLLRREKSKVAAELPPKTEIVNEVELSGPQRDLYESIRATLHEKVQREIDKKGIERSQILILDALLKLRQVCCDPRLLKLEAARKVTRSAKLELLDEMLPGMIEEGRRILLFSQFTGMLALIEEQLKGNGIDYVKLTGRTRNRAAPIDRFQAGEVPLFLISLKAGGTGLNLTAADTVIHYDPWWNPAVERQATDRAHRIGQEKPVFVYKLLSRGTVEERIAALQARKQELADALFGGRAGSAALNAEDLQALFEPLG